MNYQRNLQRLAMLTTEELEQSAVDREIRIPIPISQQSKDQYRGRLVKAIARSERRDHRREHKSEVAPHYGSDDEEDQDIIDDTLDEMQATAGAEEADVESKHDEENESELDTNVEERKITEEAARTGTPSEQHIQRDHNPEEEAHSNTDTNTGSTQYTVAKETLIQATRTVEEQSSKDEESSTEIPTATTAALKNTNTVQL